MLKRISLAICVLLAACFTLADASWAGFRVCNQTPQQVDVAFGYPHGQFGWTSEGWWVLQPGQCRLVMRGPLSNRYYYLFAKGSQGSIWDASDGRAGSFFCVQPDRFVFPNRNFERSGVISCPSGTVAKRFQQIDTSGGANHVHNLSM